MTEFTSVPERTRQLYTAAPTFQEQARRLQRAGMVPSPEAAQVRRSALRSARKHKQLGGFFGRQAVRLGSERYRSLAEQEFTQWRQDRTAARRLTAPSLRV